MFLYGVNNIERNLKQNIYTDMEVISLLPPWHSVWKQQEWKCTDK